MPQPKQVYQTKILPYLNRSGKNEYVQRQQLMPAPHENFYEAVDKNDDQNVAKVISDKAACHKKRYQYDSRKQCQKSQQIF